MDDWCIAMGMVPS